MLAVSTACSQVPPDHLQVSPVLVLRRLGAKQLREMLTIICPESQPRQARQDNAPCTQGGRQATASGRHNLYVTVVRDSQSLTEAESFGKSTYFVRTQKQPYDRADDTPMDCDWYCGQQREPENHRTETGYDNDAPQDRIRSEFGRVAVRRHLRVRLLAVPGTTSSS